MINGHQDWLDSLVEAAQSQAGVVVSGRLIPSV